MLGRKRFIKQKKPDLDLPDDCLQSPQLSIRARFGQGIRVSANSHLVLVTCCQALAGNTKGGSKCGRRAALIGNQPLLATGIWANIRRPRQSVHQTLDHCQCAYLHGIREKSSEGLELRWYLQTQPPQTCASGARTCMENARHGKAIPGSLWIESYLFTSTQILLSQRLSSASYGSCSRTARNPTSPCVDPGCIQTANSTTSLGNGDGYAPRHLFPNEPLQSQPLPRKVPHLTYPEQPTGPRLIRPDFREREPTKTPNLAMGV